MVAFFMEENMKGKKKILSFLFAIISIFLLEIDNVYAAQKVKISFDYQSNVYYTRKGDGLNDSHQYLYLSNILWNYNVFSSRSLQEIN